MDNKKRLEMIKKHAASSKSAKDLNSKELSEAIHGLAHREPGTGHRESIEATQHYAAAIQKHLPASVLKAELTALQSAILSEKASLQSTLTTLEDAIQKKIVESHHLPEEAAAYNLLAKLSAFCRAILFASA
jgi:hypothetical protein